MTIIDCHTHLGKNHHISANVKDLLASMKEAKIDKSLVFAGRLTGVSNEEMLEQISPHTDQLYGVAAFYRVDKDGILIPRKEVEKLASWYQEKKIVAVKFYTGYDHYYPIDVNWELSLLEEVGCPAIFHSGDCLNSAKHAKLKYALPIHIDDVANEHPKMNFIIAHFGSPWWRDTAEILYKNDNVYTDISGFVYGDFWERDRKNFKKAIGEILEITGNGDKLLFGTDWPISNQKSYLHCLRDYVGFGLTPEYLSNNVEIAFKLL